jgi:ABC-type phosphate transport system substrate-binding protein
MNMNTKTVRWIRGFLAVACLALFALEGIQAQSQHNSSIAVVVNADTPVSDLSLEDVRKIFLGERQYWTAKVPVVLLIRAPVARERETVLRVIYQMSEAQFKRYWIAKIFRAESAAAPKIVYSNDMANELAAAIPGAIAFMDFRDVRPGVKVIRIDGHLPNDPAYPLK